MIAYLMGALLLIAVVVLHWLLHRSLTPVREPVGRSLASLSLVGQSVRFPGRRGKLLRGWYLPGNPGQPVAVLAHGWSSNRLALVPLARVLNQAGLAVLLFDMRNHGESDGDTFSSLPRFAEDIHAACLHLSTLPDARDRPRLLFGHSVGGAAALLAASQRDDILAVVSISAFAHPEWVMRRWLHARRLPFWPVGWYILRYVQWVIGYCFEQIAPLNVIAKVAAPVMLVHGTEDAVVPLADAKALYQARGNTPVRLTPLPGGHDLTHSLNAARQALFDFIDQSGRAANSSR